MTPEHVRRMLACAPLLPPPGDTELAALARAYLKLHDEYEALKKSRDEHQTVKDGAA